MSQFPRDERAAQMVADPEKYFREARTRARKEAEQQVRQEREIRRRRKRG